MEIMHFTLYLIGVGNIPSKFKQKMSKNSDQLSTGCQQGGSIITKNGNRVHCYGIIRLWNVQERREVSRGATSVPGSFAMSSVIWRAVTSSARRAQKENDIIAA